MLGAHRAALQHQAHGHQHRFQPGRRHGRQHLRHHPVAALPAHQRTLQMDQGLGQVGKRRTVAQHAWLALHQRDVVLPVVAGLAPVAQAFVASHHLVVGHDHHLARVQPRAHLLPHQLAWHRVAVACHRYQASA